jgi:aldehyde dehydrogenase (NAD+)
VEAAKSAFKIGAPWRKSSGTERAALMFKLAELMERDLDQLAALESLDNGKTTKKCFLCSFF